jgi:mannose-1-phosphate guanylyltransferase
MTERRPGGPPALILAAGYGSRLAPVTDHLPKPLLPVRGRTLLDHAIAALDRAGVGSIAVNTHHLAEQIAAHLDGREDRKRFAVCHEPEILGTGGALDGARGHLEGHPFFLIHNADVLCDADLKDLVDDHVRSGAEATLLLADWPEVNSVSLNIEGAITAIGRGPSGDRRLTYTGIGVFGSSILKDIGSGFSSLIDPLMRAMAARPGSIRGWAPEGITWGDLGTLGRYLTEQGHEGEQEAGPEGHLTAITGHGSDRRFWRLAAADWSAVAMLSNPADQEFERGADIADFLNTQGLGGATVLHRDEPGRALLMEDVGAVNLLSVAQQPSQEITRVYGEVIARLLDLQANTGVAIAECPAATDRRLDEAMLLWETGYFRERFLVGYMGLTEKDLFGLDEEFSGLAKVVDAQPAVLLHRDFQSQNIHWHEGQVRLVDVQGMRLGPLGYDVMSLLMDPYVDLPENLRDDLLNTWCAEAAALPEARGASMVEVRAMAVAAGLQRIMQALGAFGFLGKVKGKRAFLDHIPAGLDRLRWLVSESARMGEVDPDAAAHLPGPMPALKGLLDSLGSGEGALPLDADDPER